VTTAAELRNMMEHIVANGKVESSELEQLRQALYRDGKIDRREADFLAELHKRIQRRTPAFEQFFYRAIKDHILADGRISAGETAWLRELLFHDGRIDDHELRFLHELKGEAKATSPEFEALFKECCGK
jgi:uncharacterized tellurite resistance protein B-like protein